MEDEYLVLKFLQTSLMEIPSQDCVYDEMPDAGEKELTAYKQLVKLQGTVVPYFYGLHIVRACTLTRCIST